MNRLITKITRKPTILYKNARSISLSSKNHGSFTKDNKPGQYPETEEERKAAALKYGMRPEEYKPMPDDGFGIGDYPDLPTKGSETKDPYQEYDFQYLRRNFGDPVHIYNEYLTPELIANDTFKIPVWKQWLLLIGFSSVFIGLAYATKDFQLGHCTMKKQYPRNVANGEQHFEI